ncbi:RHS repeat-associated core domain-containing protein [Clostridium manihotivorum]|uniref:Wall-associated protein n=1 Tax=Clostridium manihotivorum TaxID=2320868 RepID=A0A410DXJ1_9CLOT|nr:RHS repeat-associated core domain-containing protein [Clostridium manihotivorum]QAA33761.1 wall-associated protein [Clostridium manihotivorum]
MNLNGSEYYYIRNAQGDIIGLIDNTGTQVVSYTYDTWGKIISTTGILGSTVGAKNPYRYRGYRYDTETGLYYLQSRYYNPDWGRVINADDTDQLNNTNEDLLDYSMFAYCNNNPVNKIDSDGRFAFALGIYAIPGIGEVALGITVSGMALYGAYRAGTWVRHKINSYSIKYSKTKEPASSGSLQKEVEKWQAPREVDRVDKPHVSGQKPHVHFKDGTFLNNDGTIHDAHKGTPKPNNKTKKWLNKKGWQVR